MITYWTQDQSNGPHAFMLVIDILVIAATLLALQYLDLRNRQNARIIYAGVLSSFLNTLLTYFLDIKLFGEISDRLYLVASIFYLGTWVVYLYLIWIESSAIGSIAKDEKKILLVTFAISASGLIPAVAFFLQSAVVGYSYIQVYYWGIPVVLFNPVFDITVLYLLKERLYKVKGWQIPLHIKLSIFIMISLKLWLLLIFASPALSLYCQFEELAMHIAVFTVVLVFIDIQQNFIQQNLSTKLPTRSLGKSTNSINNLSAKRSVTISVDKVSPRETVSLPADKKPNV